MTSQPGQHSEPGQPEAAATLHDLVADLTRLAEHLDSEAATASRSGQMASLERQAARLRQSVDGLGDLAAQSWDECAAAHMAWMVRSDFTPPPTNPFRTQTDDVNREDTP